MTQNQENPKEEQIKKFLEEQGDIPKRYITARLSDSPITLNPDASVFFYSEKTGTGKTHLAWAYYINELIKSGKQKPLFSTFGQLQLRLRQSMDKPTESENDIINDFSRRKLVILDDLGGLRPSNTSDYSLSMVFEILNNRYSWVRQTIITSNKNLEEIENNFDARIASRISGWCEIINLPGDDKRIKPVA